MTGPHAPPALLALQHLREQDLVMKLVIPLLYNMNFSTVDYPSRSI